MARRFSHFSLGILALIVAYHLGTSRPGGSSLLFPRPAAAGVVLDGEVGIVSQFAEWMLDSNGDVWIAANCWEQADIVPLPIPVSELKFWHPTALVTKDNVLWHVHDGVWENCGVWPGGPVPVDKSTWGSIKERFHK